MIRLYRKLLDNILTQLVRHGELQVLWPDDTRSEYGATSGPRAGMRLTSAAWVRRIALNPGLALGEAYMEGGLVPFNGNIHDLLTLFMANLEHVRLPVLERHAGLARALRRFTQANDARRAKRNVAHHYDLNGRLYSLFLDRDRQYSCAYFGAGNESLEEAQAAKKRHIAAKLKLDRPGLTVLDIGCGWGGMALTLARDYGAHVTGITLSEEQLAAARARAVEAGLADRVSFELRDYRHVDQRFDRIVSVGMFEHVGVPNYPAFFATVKRCLAPDGVALLHSIGRADGPGVTNAWVQKYIFPGGYSPALSEVLGGIEQAGLWVTDIEILRLHYAKTIAHWRRRFAANRDTIAALYDERFCRMFEYYLSGSELVFRHGGHMNFQIQMAADLRALPLTRDYMVEREKAAAFAPAAE